MPSLSARANKKTRKSWDDEKTKKGGKKKFSVSTPRLILFHLGNGDAGRNTNFLEEEARRIPWNEGDRYAPQGGESGKMGE